MNNQEFLKQGVENYMEIRGTMLHFKSEMEKVFTTAILEHRKENLEIWPIDLQTATPSITLNNITDYFTVTITDKKKATLEVGISWVERKKQNLSIPRLHAARWKSRNGKLGIQDPNSQYMTYDDRYCDRLTLKNGPLKFEDEQVLKIEIKNLLTELLKNF
jgi:hypothetical protein